MVKLVKSNIRKDRAVFTAFLMIIILSTLLLNIGLFMKKYDAQYDEKKEREGIGDVELFATGYSDEVSEILNGISDVKDYRLSDIIRSEETYLSSVDKKYEENTIDRTIADSQYGSLCPRTSSQTCRVSDRHPHGT
jgi:hypothetical protein